MFSREQRKGGRLTTTRRRTRSVRYLSEETWPGEREREGEIGRERKMETSYGNKFRLNPSPILTKK